MAAQIYSRPLGEENCILHPEEKLLFECKDCNEELTCIECVGTVHHGHAMVRLKQTIEEKVAKIEEFITKAKDVILPKVVKDIKLTIDKLQKNKEKCQHEIREVKEQEKRLIKLVQHSYTNISKFELLLEQMTDLLNKYKSDLEELKQATENDIKHYEETVKSGTEVLKHDTAIQLVKRKTNVKISEVPVVKLSCFSPCKDPSALIEVAFGEVIDTVENSGDKKAAQVLSKYKFLDQPKVLFESPTSYTVAFNSIYCTQNNNTWVLDDDGIFHCYNHTGKEIQMLKPDIRLVRICIHPTTTELFGTPKQTFLHTDKSIRRVDNKTGMTSIMFCIDDVPGTIGCTSNNQIVVGTTGTALVQMFSFEGQILHTHNYTGDNIPTISICPITNCIALTGGSNLVTVLDRTLREMYKYRRRSTKCIFWTAAFTHKYLLVGDQKNKMILVLDKETLVRTIHTTEISPVLALSVRRNCVLQVGCERTNKILQIKYIE